MVIRQLLTLTFAFGLSLALSATSSQSVSAQGLVDVTVSGGRVDVTGTGAADSVEIRLVRGGSRLRVLGMNGTRISLDGAGSRGRVLVDPPSTLRVRTRGGADNIEIINVDVDRLVLRSGGGNDDVVIDNTMASSALLAGGGGSDMLVEDDSFFADSTVSSFEIQPSAPGPGPALAPGEVLVDGSVSFVRPPFTGVTYVVTEEVLGLTTFIDNFISRSPFGGPTNTLDLSRIDADTTRPGDQAFRIVSQFTGTPGELTLSPPPTGADSNVVQSLNGDVDGDGVADLELRLVVTTVPVTSLSSVLIP